MLSLRCVSFEQALTYYQKENYYAKETAQELSQWWGAGADRLGLSGAVDFATFREVLQGHAPNGRVLREFSDKELKRAGTDLTFSAPKSVSLAALVGGDQRLLVAMRESVQEALQMVQERYSWTRVGSKENRKTVVTGNLVSALFEHDVSRKKDPQLHIHALVMNLTERKDGKWRSVHNDGFFQASKLAGLVFQNALARKAKELGYEIEQKLNGTFELKGYTPEQLEHFSQRRAQIEALGATNQKEARQAVLQNRDAKGPEIPRVELEEQWRKRAQEIGLSHPVSVQRHVGVSLTSHAWKSPLEAAKSRVSFLEATLHVVETLKKSVPLGTIARVDLRRLKTAFEKASRWLLAEENRGHSNTDSLGATRRLPPEIQFPGAANAVRSALADVTEKQVAVRREKLEEAALLGRLGENRWEELQKVMRDLPQLIRTLDDRLTSVESLKAEAGVLKLALEGQGLFQHIATPDRVLEHLNQFLTLSTQDAKAILENLRQILQKTSLSQGKKDTLHAEISRALLMGQRLSASDLLAFKDRFRSEVSQTLGPKREKREEKKLRIANEKSFGKALDRAMSLTEGQRKAIVDAVLSRDQVQIWQGVAGAGKTFSLREVSNLAKEAGYEVQGFAPSAAASLELSHGAGIEARTVASHLQEASQGTNQKQLWIIDEAGTLGTRDTLRLLEKAHAEQARVIFVGDTRQLSAVEAGNPFAQMQAHGVAVSRLDESLRQKTVPLREAASLITQGKMEEGLKKISDRIKEQKNDVSRYQNVAKEFLQLSKEERSKTLVLAGTHKDRYEIIDRIRSGLKKEGSLGQETAVKAIRKVDLSKERLKLSASYEPGFVVVPSFYDKSLGLKKNAEYIVQGTEDKTNKILLQGPTGELVRLDPAACKGRLEVYHEKMLPVAVGDKMRWTENNHATGQINGHQFFVESINGHMAQVKGLDGKSSVVDLNKRQRMDYAWATTTFSSQGATSERVIICADQTFKKEAVLVAVTRASHEISIHTASTEKFIELAQKSGSNEIAEKLVAPDIWDRFGKEIQLRQVEKATVASKEVGLKQERTKSQSQNKMGRGI